MENSENMKTNEFLKEICRLELFDEFADHFTEYMAELDEGHAEEENDVHKTFWDKIATEQESDNRLCEYLKEYIGPRIPISEQDFLAATSCIWSLRADIDALSATLDRWGKDPYDIWGEILWEIESCPLKEWTERIVEQVRASKLEAA